MHHGLVSGIKRVLAEAIFAKLFGLVGAPPSESLRLNCRINDSDPLIAGAKSKGSIKRVRAIKRVRVLDFYHGSS